MQDDPPDVVPAMELAQQYEQVVTDRAGHAAVSQFQNGLRSSPDPRDGPLDDVPVESVRDDDSPRVACQHVHHRVGIGLSGHE